MVDDKHAVEQDLFDNVERLLRLFKRFLWGGCSLVCLSLFSVFLTTAFQNTWLDEFSLISFCLAVVLLLSSLFIWLLAGIKSRLFARKNIFPTVAEQYFESDFAHGQQLDDNTILWLNKWLFPKYHKRRYGESIQGIYCGRFWQITELELTHVKTVTIQVEKKDSNGNTYTETETREEKTCVFKGPVFLTSYFPRKPSDTVALYPNSLSFGTGKWQTESIEFNKLFFSSSNDGQSFFKVFSPAFIDRILSLDESTKKYMRMCIAPNGHVSISINSGYMRLNSASDNGIISQLEDIEVYKQTYSRELDSLFQFITQLDVHGS